LLPKWKISFRILGVKISKDWQRGKFFLSPHERQDIAETNGYFIVECKEQDEAIEKSREAIEKFMGCYSIRTKATRFRIEYLPPDILNEPELKANKLPIPENPIKLVGMIVDPSTIQDLDQSYTLFEDINKHEKSYNMGRILRWYTRALEYDDPYDKFIALWISFNSFYNLYYIGPSDKDAAKIDYLCTNLFNSNDARIFLQSKSSTKVTKKLVSLTGDFKSTTGNTDFAQSLDQSLKARRYSEALKYAMRCVYGIRKTLFHGDRNITQKDKKIVEEINPMVKCLIQESIQKFI